jgi:hypothetical protein
MNEINWNEKIGILDDVDDMVEATVGGMYCIKEKIDPSRESEPKNFHLNYSLVGLSLKCLHFLSFSGDLNSNLFNVNNNKLVDLMTTFNLRNVILKPTRLNNLLDPIIISDTPLWAVCIA